METGEFDVNKEIKKEVPWEDELLFDKKVANVEVKSEPEAFSLELENHEMIEIKDEFGKTMEDFDLSHVKSTSETVDCSDFKSLGCDKSSAHEIVSSNDFQNSAQRKGSIMPLFPEFEDYSFHCEQCPYSATSESNLTNHKEDAHQPSKVIEPSPPKEPSNVGYQLNEDITAQGLNPTIDCSDSNSNDESEKKEKSERSHEIVSPNDVQDESLQNFAQGKGTHLIDHNYFFEQTFGKIHSESHLEKQSHDWIYHGLDFQSFFFISFIFCLTLRIVSG